MRTILFFLFLGFTMLLNTSQVQAAEINILGDESLVLIDPDKSTGKTSVILQNVSGKDLAVLLNAKKMVSLATGNMVAGLVQFQVSGGQAWATVLKSALKKDDILAVEVQVSEFVLSGEAYFYLLNGADTLCRVTVIHGNIPFNVTLVSDNPNEPEITLHRGDMTEMVLKNDDAIPYRIDWSLYLPGTGIYLSDSMVLCPAKQSTRIPLYTDRTLFENKFEGIFRDQEEKAQLMLSYRPAGDLEFSFPSKTIQVKAWLKYHSDRKQAFWGNFIIFVILAAGGIASAFLNIWMPNRQKKNNLLKQLDKISLLTHEISFQIDSGLRVEIRVNRMQIREELNSLRAFYPESKQTFENIQKKVEILATRVELVRKLDNVTQAFEAQKGNAFSAPAKRMDMVNDWLAEVTEKLMLSMPEEGDLKLASENIKKAGDLLEDMTREDPKFAEQLAESLKPLIASFASLQGSHTITSIRENIQNLLSPVVQPELAEKFSDPKNIQPRHYHWLSSTIERLFVLRQVINLWEGHPDRKMSSEMSETDLVNNLSSRTWHSLQELRLFRNELAENIFPETLIQAIENKEFRIDASPTLHPKANEKVCLEVVFFQGRFNDCSARESIRCDWDFEEIGLERGWSIMHYFRTQEEAAFKMRFFRKDGQKILVDGKNELAVKDIKVLESKKKKNRGQWWLEIARFAIAFIIAIFALFIGAKEQFFKLDLVSGLIAVFLLGYGADSIKNLATKKKTEQEG